MDDNQLQNQNQQIPNTSDMSQSVPQPPVSQDQQQNQYYPEPQQNLQAQNQGQQLAGTVMPQQPVQPQVVEPSPSPEVPARIESQENVVMPEQNVKQESQVEPVVKSEEQQEEKKVDAPEVIPNLTKFESPFKVYGYNLSKQLTDMKDVGLDSSVRGDTSVAKTWLIVLVGRLLRMYKVEENSTPSQ